VRRRLPDEEPDKYAVARNVGGASGVLMLVLEAASDRATGAGEDGRLRAWGGCVDAVEFAGAYAGPSRGGAGDASSSVLLLLLSGEVVLMSVAMDLVEGVDSTTSVPLFILFFFSLRVFLVLVLLVDYVFLRLLSLRIIRRMRRAGGGKCSSVLFGEISRAKDSKAEVGKTEPNRTPSGRRHALCPFRRWCCEGGLSIYPVENVFGYCCCFEKYAT